MGFCGGKLLFASVNFEPDISTADAKATHFHTDSYVILW